MGTITKDYNFTAGTTIDPTQVNANFDTIYTEFNGSISNANISASAAVAYSKLNLTGAVLNADLAGSIASTKISNTAAVLGADNAFTAKNTFKNTVQTLVTATDGSTVTFDLSSGNIQSVTLGGNRTLALSNGTVGQCFILRLIQDGTGSRTVTWFSTIKWPGGSAPTLTTTASKIDVFGFITTSSGNYDAFIIGQNL